jgi:hypothetical protein
VVNQGKDDEVPTQFARWVHGVVGKGAKRHMAVIGDLVRRRGNDTRIWTVTFQAIPDHYPGDTQQGLGVGVGTATPGSESPDPATPVDSAFEKFTGSCTGTGSCVLTPSSNKRSSTCTSSRRSSR